LKHTWAVPVIVGILILGLFPLDAFAEGPAVFTLKWGSFCRISDGLDCVDPDGAGPLNLGDGQFFEPEGVAVDSSGNVYVVGRSNDRIQKFDSNGTFLDKWGSSGSGDGQFDRPQGVAVDAAGNVYVADVFNDRIQKFDSNGTFLTKWGSSGSGDGQFSTPIGVAVDSFDDVYVADNGNQRIQKFDSNGTFLTKWGSFGSGDGQFDAPWSVAVDSSGKVYVVEIGNDRIQRFSPVLICGSGTILGNNLECVADLDSICGEGTIISGMQCIGLAMQAVGGTLLKINTFALFVGAIGVNPIITGLVAITIAGVAGQVAWLVHKKKRR